MSRSKTLRNQSPFMQSQRDFPDKMTELVEEVFRAYVDTAQKVNERTIGNFSANRPSATGENWFLTSQPMQTQRQLYPITTVAAGPYPHGINTALIVGFTRIYGVATDDTSWYPLPYVDATSATDQIQIVVTSTDIVLTAGGGSPPAITKGYIVLEWLSRTSSTPSMPST